MLIPLFDLRAAANAIQDKFVAGKKALHQDINKDRTDLRQDRRQLQIEHHDLVRDQHERRGQDKKPAGKR